MKKKMSKRILCLLLAMAMVFAMLAGCGSSSDEDEEEETETEAETEEVTEEAGEEEETEEAEEAAAEEEVVEEDSYFPLEEEGEISMFISFIPPVVAQIGDDPSTYTVWSEMASRLNVDIEFNVTTHDVFTEKTMLILSSGDYPDIMMNLLEQAYNFSGDRALEDETVVDLTDYIEEYMPNYYSYLSSSDDYLRDATTDEGRIAAVYCLWNDEVGAEYGPVIRQDWLDELGMDSPETYDDYYEVLTAFKTELGATAALWFSSDGGITGNYLSSGFGVPMCVGTEYSNYVMVVDGEIVFGPYEDGFYDYISTMQKWYAEGLIQQDYYDSNYDKANIDDSLITTDSTGIWYVYNEYMHGYYEELSEDEDFEMVAIQDAVLEEGGTSHLTVKVNLVSTNHACVMDGCEDIELVCRFLDYIFSDEGMILFNYGVEGEGFYYDDDGNPVLSELITDNPDGLSTTAALTKYAQQQGLMLCDVDRFSVIYTQEEVSIWNTTDDDWFFPSWVSLTSDESTEVTNILADFYTYMDENVTKFIVGEYDMDYWDTFIATMEQFDIDTVLDVLTDAYARYLAR